MLSNNIRLVYFIYGEQKKGNGKSYDALHEHMTELLKLHYHLKDHLFIELLNVDAYIR